MKKLAFLLLPLALGVLACNDNKDALVVIHTEFGDMKVILYDETPLHKENFLKRVKSGEYNDTKWHRVIQGFMIQGGDVYAKAGKTEPESDRIAAEIVPGFRHTKGALAAARQGDQINPQKKSSGSQFYIVHGRTFSEAELTTDQVKLNQAISQMLQDTTKYDSLYRMFVNLQRLGDFNGMQKLALDCRPYVEQELGFSVGLPADPEKVEIYSQTPGAPHLDNEYTIFGRVVEGLEIVDQIAEVPTGPGDKPVKDTFVTMEVEMVSKKEITEKYGYVYPTKD